MVVVITIEGRNVHLSYISFFGSMASDDHNTVPARNKEGKKAIPP